MSQQLPCQAELTADTGMTLAPGLPAALPTGEQELAPPEDFAEKQPFGAGLDLCSRNSSKGLL